MEILDHEINRFNRAMQPWGSIDVASAVQTYLNAGKYSDDLAEAITEFKESIREQDDAKIDPCFVAYDSLHQIARQEIEDATGKDICNDDPFSGVYVHGNYYGTDFDGSSEARQAIRKLIKKIKEPSEVVKWLDVQMEE